MAKKQAAKKRGTSRKVTKETTPVTSPVEQKTSTASAADSRRRMYLILGVAVVAALLIAGYMIYRKVFVAAYVNGQPVSRLSVISQLEKQAGKNVLDQEITKKLITQEAQKRHVSVTQADIDKEMKTIENNVKAQGMTLDQALASQGMTKSQLTDEVRIQLMLEKMVKQPAVTDKDVADYIAAHQDEYSQDADQASVSAQVKTQLQQQKQQTDLQNFIADLKKKAKITYITQY